MILKNILMKPRTVLERTLKYAVIVGAIAGTSFLTGAVAQRSCWPRFCTQTSSMPVDSLIESTHARIATKSIPLPFSHQYGALEVLEAAYVVASGTGEIFHVDENMKTTRLPFAIPLRDAEFNRDNGSVGIQPNSFSVKDILVRRLASSDVEILATYHVWFPERKCFTLRMSSAIADGELKRLRREWRTVFDSSPCSAVKSDGVRFAGTGAGGRMSRVSGTEVLLTVGDHEFDGAAGTPSQDPASTFGKTILINTVSGAARTFSTGHRNPQGLVRARDGRVWSTEHGPKGGDELNLVQDGQNYGWPFATYGAQYSEYAWPLQPSAAQRTAFAQPIYAWVPSVGVSQLIQVEGKGFSGWAGDLLVSSLRGASLFRIRVEGERVAFAEQIQVGARIRDLAEHPDGTIALLSTGRLILLRPAGKSDVSAAVAAAPRTSLLASFFDTTRTLVKDLAGKQAF